MINWGTLKLIITPESTIETLISILILNALLFLILGLISSIILIVVTGGEYIDATRIKNNKLRIAQIIVMITIMLVATLIYFSNSRESYYTIKVGIIADELQAQDIHNIREMKEFPEKLILEKFNDKDSLEMNTTYKYKTISNYFSRYTKLKNENGKIIFTTKLAKSDYEKYETPEEFKHDIETLVKYTIEYTNDQITKRPEIMEKFTKEHLTKVQ